MDNVLHLIGIAKRGGHLEVGEEPVGAACRAKDSRLVLVARDAADNTYRRVRHFAEAGACLWISIPYTKAELGEATGRSSCAMAAVTDLGLAGAIVEQLAKEEPEKYGQTAQRLQEKARRAQQRREEQRAHEKNAQRGGKKAKPFVPTRIKRELKKQSK